MAEITLTPNPTADELRAAFVAAARSLVGSPYAYRGRSRDVGFDCLGVLLAAADICGFELHDYEYHIVPEGDLLDTKLAEHMVRLQHWRDARPGDVVTRCYRLNEPAKHCGVVTLNEVDNLRCVHAYRYRATRCVTEGRWTDPIFNVSAFRVREIAALEDV